MDEDPGLSQADLKNGLRKFSGCIVEKKMDSRHKKHQCKYCKEEFFKNCIGKHIINHHSDQLKTHFAPYKNAKKPVFPFMGTHNYYICLCCGEYWAPNAPGRVLNHCSKGKCSEQGMLEAIYVLLGERPAAVEPQNKLAQESSNAAMEQLVKDNAKQAAEIKKLREELAEMKDKYDMLQKNYLKQLQQKQQIEPEVEPEAPKTEKKAAPKPPKASKAEKEAGMWCTTCESCKNTAQFATDLKQCASCKKMCHFNSDLHSCYHWDCEICDSKICLECVKKAGGSKMHPLCSGRCHADWKVRRGEF